ncbi:MAG TPA: CPBP family intramembrane glutamic endopeptidase [Opitutaceae bacterium]|jgi:membrane protease YdiL (CAAX protease family)|nr:CPBP family intramembrane glutamic endopeptidase [Opitutaceae bacterium]
MPDHITPVLTIALTAEIILSLAGLVVWLLVALRPAVRTQPARLAPWPVSFSDFLACALSVIGGGLFLQVLGRAISDPLLKKFSASHDTHIVVYGAAFQVGLLAGVAVAGSYLRTRWESREASVPPRRGACFLLLAGMLTFLAVLPVVYLTGYAWNQFLAWLGFPPEPQELVEVFAHAKLSVSSVVLFLLATITAPVVEELIFRAGLFRYLRTRVPRWAALTLPALFFAGLHVDWKTLSGLGSLAPLVVLAIIFSLAYERTGRIGVTMIAHAIFNLNMILLIMVGMPA